MIRARLTVFPAILLLALLLALFTAYAYGGLFSHPRYWSGTIERVAVGQAALIRSMITEMVADRVVPSDSASLARMFAPIDNRLIVEVRQQQEIRWTNANERFARGKELDTLALSDDRQLVLSSYQPPAWNRLFLRWLSQPARWFEPSFDPVTMPFLWFFAIYSLSLLALGLMVRATYLERDVLGLFKQLDQRYNS